MAKMGAMEYRSTMDTATEFAPYEDAIGKTLDLFGEPHGVMRLEGEDDHSYRERIREAVRVRKKSERVERGESLIPSGMVEEVNPSMVPVPADLAEMQAEAHFATERVKMLEEQNRVQRDTLLGLRAVIKDVALSAKVGSWDGVNKALARVKHLE